MLPVDGHEVDDEDVGCGPLTATGRCIGVAVAAPGRIFGSTGAPPRAKAGIRCALAVWKSLDTLMLYFDR